MSNKFQTEYGFPDFQSGYPDVDPRSSKPHPAYQFSESGYPNVIQRIIIKKNGFPVERQLIFGNYFDSY